MKTRYANSKPSTAKRQVGIRLDKELYDRLNKLRKNTGAPLTHYIVKAIIVALPEIERRSL